MEELSYIYLASPYSDPDPLVRESRYEKMAEVLVKQYLLKCRWAYSPIVHCHEIAKRFSMPKEAAYWAAFNRAMLFNAESLHVIMIEGYIHSIGVQDEIKQAQEYGHPILFVRVEV